ncbi:hypothetical protein [Methylomonas albis]|uniref:Uncharacterized protein n=1 Tax=Methylomonas albis TaxID=1854563 RepID=A0ABR9D4H7_9GAMM|nr:hypothetical protein [Methylomonas albis]MBD9358024.1 hypothetical protein [Methylomonas albis]CAD6881376.1 hypothetical protein [Methylomonas albis]
MQAQSQLFPKHSGLPSTTEAADFLPSPETGSVRVWQLNLDALSGFTDQLEAILSPDERERAHAFATPNCNSASLADAERYD